MSGPLYEHGRQEFEAGRLSLDGGSETVSPVRLILTCRGCGAELRIRATDPQAIPIGAAQGWSITSETGALCPGCDDPTSGRDPEDVMADHDLTFCDKPMCGSSFNPRGASPDQSPVPDGWHWSSEQGWRCPLHPTQAMSKIVSERFTCEADGCDLSVQFKGPTRASCVKTAENQGWFVSVATWCPDHAPESYAPGIDDDPPIPSDLDGLMRSLPGRVCVTSSGAAGVLCGNVNCDRIVWFPSRPNETIEVALMDAGMARISGRVWQCDEHPKPWTDDSMSYRFSCCVPGCAERPAPARGWAGVQAKTRAEAIDVINARGWRRAGDRNWLCPEHTDMANDRVFVARLDRGSIVLGHGDELAVACAQPECPVSVVWSSAFGEPSLPDAIGHWAANRWRCRGH